MYVDQGANGLVIQGTIEGVRDNLIDLLLLKHREEFVRNQEIYGQQRMNGSSRTRKSERQGMWCS